MHQLLARPACPPTCCTSSGRARPLDNARRGATTEHDRLLAEIDALAGRLDAGDRREPGRRAGRQRRGLIRDA